MTDTEFEVVLPELLRTEQEVLLYLSNFESEISSLDSAAIKGSKRVLIDKGVITPSDENVTELGKKVLAQILMKRSDDKKKIRAALNLDQDHTPGSVKAPFRQCPPPGEHKKINDTDKGLKYDGEKVRMDLLEPSVLVEEAKVLTYGALKYEAWNWAQGINEDRLYGAALRHLAAAASGETFDPESGLYHLAHARCMLAFWLAGKLSERPDIGSADPEYPCRPGRVDWNMPDWKVEERDGKTIITIG